MRSRDRYARQRVRKPSGRHLATSLALVALFFAGASVSAWAGGEVGGLTGSTDETTTERSTVETTTEQGTVPSAPPGSLEDPAQRVQRLVRASASRLRPVGGTRQACSAPRADGARSRDAPAGHRRDDLAAPTATRPHTSGAASRPRLCRSAR